MWVALALETLLNQAEIKEGQFTQRTSLSVTLFAWKFCGCNGLLAALPAPRCAGNLIVTLEIGEVRSK